MILSRTPFRLSFVGGGSDLPAFCERAPGAVLSVTLDRAMYLMVHPFHDPHRLHLRYARSELVDDVDAVAHPILKEALRLTGIRSGVEISSTADVPAGTGLGSSSAFAVGLLHALAAFVGHAPSPEALAATAAHIEIDRLGEPIGRQDHYAAAYGGLNVLRFGPGGHTVVEPVPLSAELLGALQARCLMFAVGESRDTRTVLSDQSRNVAMEPARFDATARMVDLVWALRDALLAGAIHEVGPLLHRNWELKRGLSARISTGRVDDAYAAARAAGATGGKLLGAGGGGYLLVVAEPPDHPAVRAALAGHSELPVRFTHQGSTIAFTDGAPPWTSATTSSPTWIG